MEAEKLKELIGFNEEWEQGVGIPNNIFEKLLKLNKSGELKSQHIAFAYSYIYLQTYLFRYAKYDKYIPSASVVKEILGYSPTNKTLDYIIKKNGLLDKNKITHTSNDFVVLAQFEEDAFSIDKNLIFTYASELYEMEQFRTSRKIGLSQMFKIPIFGFYSNPDDYGSDEPFNGTFFEYDDGSSEAYTFIDFNIFAYMMENEDLGVNAFYLYSYLQHKNYIHPEGYNATSGRLSNEIGLSSRTIERYRDNMRSYNTISLIHEMDYFVVGLKSKSERKASANIVNPFNSFTYKKIQYDKQTKISYEAYKDFRKAEEEKLYIIDKPTEIDELNLPY